MYSIKFLLAKLLQRLNISEIRDSSLHQNARISPGEISSKKNFSAHEFSPYKKTKIDHDIRIGEKVIILGGVRIGTGAIIGTGSIVTKDIPPYHIYAGNPARCIRARFDKENAEKLLKLNFYEWSDDEIKKIAPYINDITKFFSFVTQNQQ